MRYVSALVLAFACRPPPAGLRPTPPGDGPVVRVDWDAEPLPDIPFPNDLATRPDPDSPTGLRLNLPLESKGSTITDIEQEARVELNKRSGFGVFAPILVSFDGALDIAAILARHPDDFDRKDAFRDDAFYVVNVDPSSPGFGELVALDVGGGRFPLDRTHDGGYLTADPREQEPSLLLETAEEDLDLDGELDPGEDTDSDGVLDHPNVWPPGGDPRQDLLTFYVMQSNTLMLRPIVPLRESTRYAVVLTSDLVDARGEPVRSPWSWVNHTRQTEALLPVISALAAVGRDLDDIAFAWSFTTGSITTDLWQVTEGVRGRGAFGWLADEVPAGVTEAHYLHSLPDVPPTWLPIDQLIEPLSLIGYLPPESVDLLGDAYGTFADAVVGGTFVSPNLLVEPGGDETDDPDAHWDIDENTGRATMRPRRIAFSCVIPKAGDGIGPPWPIAIHAHGYGSTRVEFVAFAHALARHGVASCGIDAPGHGLPLDESTEELVAGLLQLTKTEPMWWHLLTDRRRDIDNDGLLDPGGDMFTADTFHSRDMIRQGVVDWAQLIESLRACGTGTMDQVIVTADGPIVLGAPAVSCDFDGDGQADLGGPETRFLLEGVSQGGIMTGVSIAVNPSDTAALTVPGGGLADIGGRTEIDAVRTAMVGRALSPLVLIEPSDAGLTVSQAAISVDEEIVVPIATVPVAPYGGRIVVRNLDLDRSASATFRGETLRIPIAANALNPGEKRALAGIPPGPSEGMYAVDLNAGLGDRLVIELYDAQGRLVQTVDAFSELQTFEGVTYRKGSPLVALSWGIGMRRGDPGLIRLLSALAIGVEPADPLVYAHRWSEDPFDGPKNVLIHLTIGDESVPSSSGVALARAAGIIDTDTRDERYSKTADRWLVERGVVSGQEEFGPWRDAAGQAILFDPDDLDNGTDGTDAPSDAPLRASTPTKTGVHALRFLYIEPTGSHAYILPDQSQAFDWELFSVQQMAHYLAGGGVAIEDDPCFATRDCPFLRPMGGEEAP